MKGAIHQEEILILNIYTPNTGTPIYIKEFLMSLRAQINTNAVIVEDLNIPLSPIDRSSRQKINKETSDLLHTLAQADMVDIYRAFHPTNRQHTFFSATHGIFFKTDHILGHKTRLNKFKKIKIIPSIISDHNGIKLDPNNNRNPPKYTNSWRLNNRLLKNQWVTELIREEIKNFLESNENENTTYQKL
jgi:exonuclease III